MKTNFDSYLEEQLKDPAFAERFREAGEAWDVALQIAALRQQAGLSQQELARRLKTSQQQISRLESPSYEGHSLRMLRRVAEALGAHLRVVFEPKKNAPAAQLAESPTPYRSRRKRTK
ncbi:MAG: XRE family transcriptional regulator [Verrucomicrobia bacterium]|nr:MAG: XRE family transcriptional regulator [Verrucomicrobiota bacterium]